jgi:hypothetical protein
MCRGGRQGVFVRRAIDEQFGDCAVEQGRNSRRGKIIIRVANDGNFIGVAAAVACARAGAKNNGCAST